MVKKRNGNTHQKKALRRVKTYDTDVAAKNIWLSLLRDFRKSEGETFCEDAEKAFLAGIPSFRDYKFPMLGSIRPGRFKRYKQMQHLLKKYRFAKDKYTDEELRILTHEQFFREQEVFASHVPIKGLAFIVLKRARKIAREILGKYDPDYTVIAGRFGRKSSIGCPLNLAYIDHKLTDVKAFSGSSECSRWFFDKVVPNDPILQTLISKLRESNPNLPYLEHESLSLINVPKSWKTYRPITPLTLLALFYSYGVGEQVTNRLRDRGLDIAHLQERHRRLVERFSVTKTHATADLSSASQSLVSALLNRILPREWYCAMKKTFSHQLVVKDVGNFYTESVLPMGNGLTFPTETLVFYVILKAIAELSGVQGLISVYGDDLIYPVRLHKFVVAVFSQLNFRLNLDKTFVEAPFRESCGSDYYRGCDVRPSFLPGEHRKLTRTKYAVWLYKIYNSLVRRWDVEEIRTTLLFILKELACTGLDLMIVPPSFPDTAGIKVLSPEVIPLDTQTLPWRRPECKFMNGSRWYVFSFLSVQPDRRVVISVLPYYWLALQGRTDDEELQNFWDTIPFKQQAPRQSLSWEAVKRVRWVKTSDGKRKRIVLKSFLATSPSRSGERITVATTTQVDGTESVSDWL